MLGGAMIFLLPKSFEPQSMFLICSNVRMNIKFL